MEQGSFENVSSPGMFLHRIWIEKSARHPSYSLRALARDLGVSHTYLSLVIHGKKKLSLKRSLEFSERLKCDPKRAELLLRVTREQASRPGVKAPSEEPYVLLEMERFRVMSDWYHVAILDLTQLATFRSDAGWVARQLGITRSQVLAAVRRLKRLGLLEVKDGRWTKAHSCLAIPTQRRDEALRRFHSQMIGRALESVKHPRNGEAASRDITGMTLPVNPEKLPEAKRKIEKFRKSLARFLSEGACTELYQINVQLFPLSKRADRRSA